MQETQEAWAQPWLGRSPREGNGFPSGASGKDPACQRRDLNLIFSPSSFLFVSVSFKKEFKMFTVIHNAFSNLFSKL